MKEWISVKDKLPSHRQKILVYTQKGQAVCIFVDSIKMNDELCKKGYASEMVNVEENPYYFCSQETNSHTLKGVTHWMPLPNKPE